MMNDRPSRSLSACRAWLSGGVLALLAAAPGFPRPQLSLHPDLLIQGDCTAFAFSPDGQRVAYSVRHLMKSKHYDLQRDDLWIASLEGRKTRIVNGEKLVRGNAPFSYSVQAISWSPDGRRLAVEMLTEQVIDERGNTQEGVLTDLMDDSGKEINFAGTKDSAILDGTQAAWLPDEQTVVYLSEAVKPHLLLGINSLRPYGGRGGRLFADHAFAAVAWDVRRSAAIAVERDPSLSGPILLVALDLEKEMRRELTQLDAFLGQLIVSPSGTRIAYFSDGNTIAVRSLEAPEKIVTVNAAFGTLAWAPDERRLLLKRGLEKKSGDLVWISLPDGKINPILSDLTFRDFAISPDGRHLGVLQPGTRSLYVYPLL